jgi:hypothetical protein
MLCSGFQPNLVISISSTYNIKHAPTVYAANIFSASTTIFKKFLLKFFGLPINDEVLQANQHLILEYQRQCEEK